MSERLDYVRYMQSYFFITLNADNQFRNIEGVITFFMNNDLGPAESWVSYVDAGIVEGVQRGGAIVLGMSDETGDNPGTTYWTSFLRGMRDGELGDRDTHDRAWSEAEQKATEYGKKRADTQFSSSAQEDVWYQITQLYRWMMRNRATCEHLINLLVLRNPKLLSAAESRIDWLTDVTNPKSGECMSQLAWDSSGLVDPAFLNLFDGDPSLEDLKDLVDGPVDNINFFLTLFMLPWSCDVI